MLLLVADILTKPFLSNEVLFMRIIIPPLKKISDELICSLKYFIRHQYKYGEI